MTLYFEKIAILYHGSNRAFSLSRITFDARNLINYSFKKQAKPGPYMSNTEPMPIITVTTTNGGYKCT